MPKSPLRLFVYSLFAAFALLYACKLRDEVLTTSPSVKLSFSRDTVFFDTVFSSVGSITKRLTVYNEAANAVNISSIDLAGGSQSVYTMIVNGEEVRRAENIRLLGKDSLMILVQVKINPAQKDLPFIVKDSIVFQTNGNRQDVKLVSWGQDATFFRFGLIKTNTTWSGTKPYVIYDTLLVDTLTTLTIEEGVSVHLAPGASMFVKGSLVIKGSDKKPVKFGGTRLDEQYRKVPGQWNGIYFLPGSKNNRVEHTIIRNGNFAFWLGTPDPDAIPDLVITNSIIENMTSAGIFSFTSDLSMTNTLVNNCAQYTVAGLAGGNYVFRHCTFAQYNTFFREKERPSFALTNTVKFGSQVVTGALKASIENSIIWGSLSEEIFLEQDKNVGFDVLFRYNLLRTQQEIFKNNNNQTSSEVRYPRFKKPEQQDFRLDTLSPAKDAGVPLGVTHDLIGTPRDSKPDIGAYERGQ